MERKSTANTFKSTSIRSKQANSNFFNNNKNSNAQNVLIIEKGLVEGASTDTEKQTISTSEKPIKISWFLDQKDQLQFKSNFQSTKLNKLGVSQCPGKKLALGRDGKKHDRDIYKDIETFKSQSNIGLIVCLLNDSELRSIGIQAIDYQIACDKQGIQLLKYPIIEMAPPDNIEKFHQDVILKMCEQLTHENQQNVLVHCRGGVGRAGLVACSILSYFCEFKNHQYVIDYVRSKRDKRCVESRKQEDFVKAYFNWIDQLMK